MEIVRIERWVDVVKDQPEITVHKATGWIGKEKPTINEDAEEIAAMVAVNQIWNKKPDDEKTVCGKENKKYFSANQDQEEISAMMRCYRTDEIEN